MIARFALVLAVFVVGFTAPAYAGPKFLGLFWWPSHWRELDGQPYLEGAKHPHNSQWDHKTWQPADWAVQYAGGAGEVIQGFYKTNILRDQYVDDDIPVLVVGPNFYHLSGYDKRRVVAMVDDFYKITTSKENGMFMLEDWRSEKPIGLYTAHGLQLQ